jgi:hypothetical protein
MSVSQYRAAIGMTIALIKWERKIGNKDSNRIPTLYLNA